MPDDFDPFANLVFGPDESALPPQPPPQVRAPVQAQAVNGYSPPAGWSGAQPPVVTPPPTIAPSAQWTRSPTPAPVAAARPPNVDARSTPPPAAPSRPPTEPKLSTSHNPAQVLEQLLRLGVSHGASDIHLLAGSPARYRMQGALRPIQGENLPAALTHAMAEHILSTQPDRKVSLSDALDIDTSYTVNGLSRFRVSILRQRGSVGLVLRVLRPDVLTIDQLTLPPQMRELASLERGLVFLCGPVGGGRSTTLAALIEEINAHRAVNIVSLEDPLELVFKSKKASIMQREVGVDVQSVAVGLRQALRHDADVIAVSELNDPAVAESLIDAAESGRLVLCTLTAGDIVKGIQRLLAFFSADDQPMIRARIADVLRAVVYQRLVPSKTAGNRLPACEILRTTAKAAEVIREGLKLVTLNALIAEGDAEANGSMMLEKGLAVLVRAGMVELEAALAISTRPTELQSALDG